MLNTARAIRFNANLPKCFWGECALVVAHIINKLPVAKLCWKTPYEILHGKLPTYYNLKVIGYLCYAAIIGNNANFEPRARQCMFLGYPLEQKGYKYMILKINKSLLVEMLFLMKFFSLQCFH